MIAASDAASVQCRWPIWCATVQPSGVVTVAQPAAGQPRDPRVELQALGREVRQDVLQGASCDLQLVVEDDGPGVEHGGPALVSSVSEAARPKIALNRASAKRPATIEGMPVMTSTRKVSTRESRLFLPYSTR